MDRVEFLKKLFDYLNQQIRYALLRNFEGLPEQNDSRDIDIAIVQCVWNHPSYIIDKVIANPGLLKQMMI